MKKAYIYTIILAVISIYTISCSKKKQQETIVVNSMNLINDIKLNRNKETNTLQISIQLNEPWQLFSGNHPDSIDKSKAILQGNTSGDYAIPQDTNALTQRKYYLLETSKGSAIIAERHLPLKGGINFRDMGGFPTQDGHYVKWGKVFRSDELNKLTETDLNYLQSIPVISVVDFRTNEEINLSPDKLPKGANYHHLQIGYGNLSVNHIMVLAQEGEPKIIELMEQMNRSFSTDSTIIKQYKELFQLLQNPKNTPLMFHCSAGKDRTGMAAALFLSSLGVNEEVILDDYLSSNFYLGDKYANYIAQKPELKPLMEVRKEYLQAGLNEIKKNHTSVENYLTNVLNVDLKRMKELYVEK